MNVKCLGANKRHICMAATSGNWVKASSYDKTHPNWGCAPLTEDGDTALHIAVSMEHTGFVEKLVERMSMQDMEIVKADGSTAFCMAAISGNVKIVTILLRKNRRLLWIRGQENMLPIQLASSAGQSHMVKILFERTCEDLDTISFQDIVKLFFLALTNNIYSKLSKISTFLPWVLIKICLNPEVDLIYKNSSKTLLN